jgi:hypothetical protein
MSKQGDEINLMADFNLYMCGHGPSGAELAHAPSLNLWEVCVTRDRDDQRVMTLTGVVRGHPAEADGRTIETPPLVWLDRKHQWARTLNRVYRLEGSDTRWQRV